MYHSLLTKNGRIAVGAAIIFGTTCSLGYLMYHSNNRPTVITPAVIDSNPVKSFEPVNENVIEKPDYNKSDTPLIDDSKYLSGKVAYERCKIESMYVIIFEPQRSGHLFQCTTPQRHAMDYLISVGDNIKIRIPKSQENRPDRFQIDLEDIVEINAKPPVLDDKAKKLIIKEQKLYSPK